MTISEWEEANVAAVKAQELLWKSQAIQHLVGAGASIESAVKAVADGDLALVVASA